MDIGVDAENLVASIAKRHHGDARASLATASAASKDLHDVGERVLAHFVAEARTSGHSWSQIGDVLGVSKQAAQKRFAAGPGTRTAIGGLFARFDSPLAQACMTAVVRAGEEGAPDVTADHLLFGVTAVGGGRGAAILGALDFSAPPRAESGSALRVLRRRRKVLPFAPDARAAFERLGAIVAERGLGAVGTEHLLLALSDDAGSPTAQELTRQGVTRAKIEHLIDHASGEATHDA